MRSLSSRAPSAWTGGAPSRSSSASSFTYEQVEEKLNAVVIIFLGFMLAGTAFLELPGKGVAWIVLIPGVAVMLLGFWGLRGWK